MYIVTNRLQYFAPASGRSKKYDEMDDRVDRRQALRLVSTRLRKRTVARYIYQQPPQAAGVQVAQNSLARVVCQAASATELRRQLH